MIFIRNKFHYKCIMNYNLKVQQLQTRLKKKIKKLSANYPNTIDIINNNLCCREIIFCTSEPRAITRCETKKKNKLKLNSTHCIHTHTEAIAIMIKCNLAFCAIFDVDEFM